MKKFDSDIVDSRIEEYISEHTFECDSILDEMHEYADESEVPIIGPLVGNFLYMITLINRAKNIFELGSGFGYSAYWFAKATGVNGRIICTDYSEDHKKKADYFFAKAGLGQLMEFRTGNSLQLLENSDERFEIIFNDVDKEFYPDVIDIAYDKLTEGGLLISDNVLWYGRVVDNDDLPSTKGVKDFNDRICSDSRFITSILPLRDGVSLSFKK